MDYTSNQSAQGLASLGRGNDSMLVHMTPREVQGLQGLAMAHGGSLTINPQTGLPEAGFLDAILPTVAGLGLNAAFPGLGALGTGLLVGGVTALASGDIGKGLMAGFGAGSGAGLGKTFAEMGKSAVGGISGNQAIGAVGQDIVQQLPANVAQNAATNLGMFNSVGATPAMGAVTGATVPTISQAASTLGDATSNLGMFNTGATGATSALAPSASQIAQSELSQPSFLGNAGNRLSQMGTGFKQFASDPFGAGYDAFKTAGGNTMDLLSPVAAVGMEALKPPTYEGYKDPNTGKYRSASGGLSLSDQFDTGLRLAEGGAISTGGIRDLYGSRDDQLNGNISRDGYGLGRLNNLANQQSLADAQITGYAMGGLTALKSGGQPGGYLNGDGDGMSDSIPATIEGKQPARLADGEFVIPADVVSHLGNGSSKAGSKRLYAMLDKVRHARTGNKKQGKEIKPEKYMPA